MNICYINGKFEFKQKCKISIEDRGFNFADSIYEVMQFKKKKVFNYELHLDRLKRSLSELKIKSPFSNSKSFEIIIKNLIILNKMHRGYVYLQISRGTSSRNHLFPKFVEPNIVVVLYKYNDNRDLKNGVHVVSIKDMRWKRCDIKTISLLPNVLGKQNAFQKNCYESWQINEKNQITEGTTSNAFIVLKNKVIQTYPKNKNILGGVTRDTTITLAKNNGYKVIEKSFNREQVINASEAFLTSTTVGILPVLSIDGFKISNSKVGNITKSLIDLHNEYFKKYTD